MNVFERYIPPRFRSVSLASFVPITAAQSEARAAVEAWLENLQSGAMLALIGKQGTGKSHLFYSAARLLLERWESNGKAGSIPLITSWYRFADELRYGRVVKYEGSSRQMEANEVRDDMWGRRIVMIDEVRPTSGTQFDDTELARFACHAYDNRIAVLITTNWNPLSGVMGEAAASRFAPVVIDGPDARQEAILAYEPIAR